MITREHVTITRNGRYTYAVERRPTQGRTVHWYAVEVEPVEYLRRCATRREAADLCRTWRDGRESLGAREATP